MNNFHSSVSALGNMDASAWGGPLGRLSAEETQGLMKALSAGNAQNNPGASPGEGFPIRVEAMEGTLFSATFRREHFALWQLMPKSGATNTVQEFNRINSFGPDRLTPWLNEIDLPPETDSEYERLYSVVKFMGVMRRVSVISSLVNSAIGNVIATYQTEGAIHLLSEITKSIYFGDPDMDARQWPGLQYQIEAGAPADNVLDLRGAPLDEDVILDGAMTVQDAPGYGRPTHLFAPLKPLADYMQALYPRTRADLFDTGSKTILSNIEAQNTPAGLIRFVPDIFLQSGRGHNGELPTAGAGDLLKKPANPTITTAIAAGATAGSETSLFSSADAGSYRFQVVARGPYGYSDPVVVSASATAIASGQKFTFGVTPGAGVIPTHYEVYRTEKGGAAGTEMLITRVANSAGTGETTITDLNENLPGTFTAFLIQNDSSNWEWKQLGPMMKIPLGVQDMSYRWMQFIAGVLQLRTPRHNVVIKNIGRRTGYYGAR